MHSFTRFFFGVFLSFFSMKKSLRARTVQFLLRNFLPESVRQQRLIGFRFFYKDFWIFFIGYRVFFLNSWLRTPEKHKFSRRKCNSRYIVPGNLPVFCFPKTTSASWRLFFDTPRKVARSGASSGSGFVGRKLPWPCCLWESCHWRHNGMCVL